MTKCEETGWLLVGHGTRHVDGRAEFESIARALAERSSHVIEPCYLELAEPTIEMALTRFSERGIKRILIAPVLLFTAGHARQDVPKAVADVAQKLGIEIVGQAASLDDHPSLIELSRQRFLKTAGNFDYRNPPELLLVGRGGSDSAAIESAHTYANVLARSLGVPGAAAFVAIAKPALPEMLMCMADRRPKQVVVQPHILFQGDVLATIHNEVESAIELYPATRWILAPHLGPHPLVVDAILNRIMQVPPEI